MDLVKAMVEVLKGKEVAELKAEVVTVQGLAQDNLKKLIAKKIDRTTYNAVKKSLEVQLEAYKAVLGEDFPKFDVDTKGTNTKVETEEGLEENIAELEEELKEKLGRRRANIDAGVLYFEDGSIKRAFAELNELKKKLAKLKGEKVEDVLTIAYSVEETKEAEAKAVELVKEAVAVAKAEAVEVVEAVEAKKAPVEAFKNSTSIKVPKKYHKFLDSLYKDVEGYFIELKEGYIFESSEAGIEVVDTQAEALDRIKNWIIEG